MAFLKGLKNLNINRVLMVVQNWVGMGMCGGRHFGTMSKKMRFYLRERPIKKMQLIYGLLPKRSNPPPPRLLELFGHFFVG